MDEPPGHFMKYHAERVRDIARAVAEEAEALGCSPAQLAIAWLRDRSPAHIPVVGARSVRHLADNLAAADVQIPPEVAGRLAAASEIELGFPRDFWRSGRPLWYGPHLERLDRRVRPHGRAMMGLE
jgi:diketogulonate reductase-like aldo/keto reductase